MVCHKCMAYTCLWQKPYAYNVTVNSTNIENEHSEKCPSYEIQINKMILSKILISCIYW
jgi:hypothetical protein